MRQIKLGRRASVAHALLAARDQQAQSRPADERDRFPRFIRSPRRPRASSVTMPCCLFACHEPHGRRGRAIGAPSCWNTSRWRDPGAADHGTTANGVDALGLRV
jgi:hypothetical protein